MTADVVERVASRIATHVRNHDLRSVRVILHGGEPLLLGPDRTAHLCEQLRRAIPASTDLSIGVQTNGTLITRDWLRVFEANRITVSFSLDGSEEANDRHRLDHGGRSSWEATIRGIEMVREHLPQAYSAILAVVDLDNDPVEVYESIAAQSPPVMEFNLPHAHHDVPPRRPRHCIEPAYGRWLAAVFDAWAAGSEYRHSIRMFEHIIGLEVGVANSVESLGLAPVDLIVVESDGSIEGVDALKAAYHGAPSLDLSVFDHDFDAALAHPAVAARQSGMAELSETCRRCDLVDTCGGGYLPHRYSTTGGFRNVSVYCADLAFLIRHVRSRMVDLQQLIAMETAGGIESAPG